MSSIKTKRPYGAYLGWAFVIIAIIVTLALAGCQKQVTGNGDSKPQPGHTTSVGPSPTASARASIGPSRPHDVIPQSQADVTKYTKLWGPPTALCVNGALTWKTRESLACHEFIDGQPEGGVDTWYGGRPA